MRVGPSAADSLGPQTCSPMIDLGLMLGLGSLPYVAWGRLGNGKALKGSFGDRSLGGSSFRVYASIVKGCIGTCEGSASCELERLGQGCF